MPTDPANPNVPAKRLKGFPASQGKVKTIPPVPGGTYDQWATRQVFLVGPNIGSQYLSGNVQIVRFRDTPNGPELDPTGEPETLEIPDLYGMAARMPEAQALIDAFNAFVPRLAAEQGKA